ncbi:uncharacterized protein KD926_006544 [Aspergillus affinis]|uniref:uncharacterized protein n=1 Tax=Aspergillus affinis TaxID=1070780 RepID=UPI0022FF350F|nr:uncharacterized protein KD926_006544 [Aspergillus affinis]KAI9041646.1 hypothetical protein KD926_006544 [Aspergillus affinis]
MTSDPKVGDAIPSPSSVPANTDTLNVQRHPAESSRAETRRRVRSRPQKQATERGFLKYPLRYILPKPPMSSGQQNLSEAGSNGGQSGTTMAIQPDTDDRTAPHAEQESWSITNLPDILYVLRPGTENAKCRHRVHRNVGPIFGKMIRNLPVLPTRLSSQVEGWRLETWMRLDRRVTPADIMDRINPLFRSNMTENDVEYRRHLFRQAFLVAHWGNQKSINDVCRLVKGIGRDPKMNSTRGLTPGLIVPAEGEAGGRIPLPPPPAPIRIRNIPEPVTMNPMPGPPKPLMQPDAVVKPQYLGECVLSFKDRDDEIAIKAPRTPMSEDHQALHRGPELKILFETPPKAKFRAVDQSDGESSMALVPRPHTPDTDRKRKIEFDPDDVFSPTPRARRKTVHHEDIPPFPAYPNPPIELASHEGPLAHFFPAPVEPEPEQEMSLEEYLDHNKLGYLEFLNARYLDDMDFSLNRGVGAWM